MIDPGAITLIQNTFLHHINDAFVYIAHYALNLLYIFTAFEVTLTGLAWAIRRDMIWGQVFFKIIKIGLIFFIIQNYVSLLDVILKSFAQLGGIVANTSHLSHVIFNPAKIWQYGYDIGLGLLKTAAVSSSIGLAIIMTTLGLGMLFVFGLLGIQIILQIVAFYLVSFTALIFLPFGVFNPTARMFDTAVQSVLKAGVRLMILILVIGMAVTIWKNFDLSGLVPPYSDVNINQPLGLFFTALLFLYLAIRLPKMVASVVGQITSQFGEDKTVVVSGGGNGPLMNATPATSMGGLATMQAATHVDPALSQAGQGFTAPRAETAAAASSLTTTTGGGGSQPISGGGQVLQSSGSKSEGASLGDANLVARSISDRTLKKMKKTFLEALREKAEKEAIQDER